MTTPTRTNLYHFCAFKKGQYPGDLIYRSGTVSCGLDLSKVKNYKRLASEIGNGFEPPSIDGADVIIVSLTVLDELTTPTTKD